MPTDLAQVSIVIPVYNEEACLGRLAATLDTFLVGFDRTCEVIMVDDGSRDRSREILREIVQARPRFKAALLRANRGQTVAMAAGLDLAKGEIIVFMDADLQNDPADIPRLIEKIDEGFDLVSGWRKDRKDRALTRKLPSRAANALIGRITGVRIHDYGCTLKAYRARYVKPLNLYSDMHRFLPALCSSTGARITEIVVRHHPRTLGSSKYGLNRIFKVVADLAVIKLIVNFADRPLHYFGLISGAFLVLAGSTSALWVWNLTRDWSEGSVIFPSLIVLFFSSFLYFLFLGLLGDLIIRSGKRSPTDLARVAATEVG